MKTLPFILLVALSLSVGAAEPGSSPAAPPSEKNDKAPASDAPKLSVTEHTITVNGQPLKYKATAGYITLSDEKPAKDDAKPGETDSTKPKAKIFFIAYTREDAGDPAKRPVTFAFNGGPGAASVWLHLGQLGPRRVQLGELTPNQGPPFALVDNDQTWLTDTDLVFIDPVSTGYSRPAGGTNASDFHAYEADIKSVADFIRLYTTQNNRWLSPKFIVGESYGGTRAAGLCDYLQGDLNFYVNGVIIVSGLLNWQNVDFSPSNDIAFVVGLPALASTAWYYKKDAPELQKQDVVQVRHAAEEFALKDYLLALGQGDQLPAADRDRIIDQLVKFTGLSREVIVSRHMRIDYGEFRRELLKSDGKAPGRFDSRYSGLVYNPDDVGDPSFVAVRGAFDATINAYLRGELKFESDLPYNILADVGPWHFDAENRYLDVGQNLAQSMTENPRLKVWILTGCYDLALSYFSTEYTITHMRRCQ